MALMESKYGQVADAKQFLNPAYFGFIDLIRVYDFASKFWKARSTRNTG
jgi:hypothetical protein